MGIGNLKLIYLKKKNVNSHKSILARALASWMTKQDLARDILISCRILQVDF